MFIKNVHGKESINTMALQLGCETGECVHGSGYGKPGIVGNTFAIKDALKAAGARFDGQCKAWTFADWSKLESALRSILSKEAV